MIPYTVELKLLAENSTTHLPGLMELLRIPKKAIPALLKAKPDGKGNYTINPGGRILGLAHMDTVFDDNPLIPEDTGNIILSPALDAGIGIYILCALRESFPDLTIVLTDNEERCNSTAQKLQPNPDYIAMIEVDRANINDSALYQYMDSPAWVDFIELHTGRIAAIGTYSDISDAEIGIAGVNLSAGYMLAHTANCYILKEDILTVYLNAYNVITALLKEKPFAFDNSQSRNFYSYAGWSKLDKWESDSEWEDSDRIDSPAQLYYCPNCGRDYDKTLESNCPYCEGMQYTGNDTPKIITGDFSNKKKKRKKWHGFKSNSYSL